MFFFGVKKMRNFPMSLFWRLEIPGKIQITKEPGHWHFTVPLFFSDNVSYNVPQILYYGRTPQTPELVLVWVL